MEFKVGDKVEIINYGTLFGVHVDLLYRFRSITLYETQGDIVYIDMDTGLIGQQGVVMQSEDTPEGVKRYAIAGPSKYAWFFEDQMRLI